MPITNPPGAPVITGDFYSQISTFLNSPTLLARYLRTLPQQRFIGDTILSGRYTVSGGSITFETGETIYTADLPRAVAPGSEYPLTTLNTGTRQVAAVAKWGQDAIITDEAVKRLNIDPVNRALVKLANQNVRYVDSIALSAVSTAVTNATAATANWVTTATAQQILSDVLNAQASILAQNQGYTPDTVVLSDGAFAAVFGKLMGASLLPRESANPVLDGGYPNFLGLNWIRTPQTPVANTAILLDSTVLGGMGDEEMAGNGYVQATPYPVFVKSIREDTSDQWRIRAARTTVPVVVEPAAAWKITGVGA